MRWLAGAALCSIAILLLRPVPESRTLRLAAGIAELPAPLEVSGANLTVRGNGTVLRAAAGFRGAALLVCRGCRNVRFIGFTVDGNRAALEVRAGLPPSDTPFARFTPNNGILLENARGVRVEGVRFTNISGFAVLASASRDIRIEGITVEDSGSRNASGRNNATGGVLLEEGAAAFRVTHSIFRNVRGNGVWTHSNYTSPRNRDGVIEGNRFERIGRDAIQAGHATNIRVEDNSGRYIGFPPEEVDIENGATPVGVDTSGNVDHSMYAGNRFEEVNGKCIDLDGFHHGQVVRNTCVNRGSAKDYPHGHFGIVVNNWNPDMKSEKIRIAGNTIDGAKFGGIFLMGERHRVVGNRLLNLNLARCNEQAAEFGCVAIQGEPDVLQAGIYLGRVAAEWAQKRATAASGILIQGNEITGWKMKERCILAAPGVSAAANIVVDNRCENLPGTQRARE